MKPLSDVVALGAALTAKMCTFLATEVLLVFVALLTKFTPALPVECHRWRLLLRGLPHSPSADTPN